MSEVKNSRHEKILIAIKGIDVWKSDMEDAYISVQFEGCQNKVNLCLRSKKANALIKFRLLQAGIKSNIKNATDEAIALLESAALISEETFKVNLRTAEHDKKIYFYLADRKENIVEIDNDGWRLVNNCPVKFVKSKASNALPEPKINGNLNEIDSLLNVSSKEDRNLIISWLLCSFFPKGPYPILIITGEQGSSKSTTTEIIRKLVDPALPVSRPLPRDVRNLMVETNHNWVMCYDNLSEINGVQSDALCRLATGGGYGVRAHYQDKEEVIFDAQRPIILNGITNTAERMDLLDRSIVIHLPTIKSEARRTIEKIGNDLEEKLPSIFGALLDMVSLVLSKKGQKYEGNLPRMADFATLILSVEQEIGWERGNFLHYYNQRKIDSNSEAIEGDVFFEAIIKLVDGKEGWEGSARELMDELEKIVDFQKRKFLPKTVGKKLTRIEPALRDYKIEVVRKNTAQKRIIQLVNLEPLNLKRDLKANDSPSIQDVKNIKL